MGLRESLTARMAAAALVAAAALGCDAAERVGGIGSGVDTRPRFPGFDIAVYPGDAAMSAWRFPASPYYWVGYYLEAPCHRDATWMGTYGRVTALGWGSLLIYVGQQDWAHIPNEILAARSGLFDAASISAVTCSASLLSTEQGRIEAADAIAKARSEGFPAGSRIFLDVEYVTSVTTPLRDYVSAWAAAVLADGRYVPALYAAKSNAPELYAVVLAAFAAAGRGDAPQFWIASSSGFTLTKHPTDVGFAYAAAWQGRFDVTESWAGVARTIDVNVATSPSPSAPTSSTSSP